MYLKYHAAASCASSDGIFSNLTCLGRESSTVYSATRCSPPLDRLTAATVNMMARHTRVMPHIFNAWGENFSLLIAFILSLAFYPACPGITL